MRWHSLTSVMLAAWAMGSLAHGAPAAPTVERSRAGNVLFQLPDGWRRKDGADGVTHLAPTSYPAGQWYNLRFLPPKPSATSLQASLREQIKAACEGSDDFREESAVVSQHQPAGYDLRMQTVSVASGEGRTYFMVYVAAAGDVVQPVLVATNSADLYNKYQKVAEKVLTGLRFCSMNRLADGDPPLTDHTVNEVNDFLEWVMQAPFTEAQRATVRKFLVKAWEGNDREEIDGVTEVLKARGELAGFAKEKRELARQAMLPELVKQWRGESDDVAKLMVRIYDGAHQPIADGDPPLTRQAADAALELLYFMAGQVAGRGQVEPDAAVREEWAKILAGGYADLDDEARQGLSEMPMTWAALRFAWPELPEDQKQTLREQWGRDPNVKQIAAAIKASNVDNRSVAEIMQSIERGRAFGKLSNISFQSHMKLTYGYRY